MKRLILLAAVAVVCWAPASAQQIVENTRREVCSPDGAYRFTFYQRAWGPGVRRMFYTLSWRGKTVVEESELGVDIDNRLFESALAIPNDTCRYWGENLNLTMARTVSRDTTWTPVYGELDRIRDHYNELTLNFRKGNNEGTTGAMATGYDKRRYYFMDIVVRAYNEGVAFAYHFPEATNGLFLHITGERSSFTMPAGTKAWYEGWAQGPYELTGLSHWKGESERPLLLELPDGRSVALGEARMTDYARGKLALDDSKPSTLKVSLYSSADIITPYTTPWRVIMAAEKQTELINHKDLYLNLNDPCRITDTGFIRPGKAFRVGQLNQAAALRGVDFARERGIDYIELDAGWYGPEMKVASDASKVAPGRDLDLPALCRYAADRGVGVWLYVNQRALYNQIDSLLPVYRRWGVKGLKFGFVQIGNQLWSTWLHDAVKKCARYGLMVDIHDEYRPTGFSRTYPNLLTQEGVRGNEEMPDAKHNTVLPFTRFLAGPADYTLCYFSGRVKNTKAHQLAMAVVYYSPLQFMFWNDRPEDYRGEAELQFWKDVPTVWDDSRALDGRAGEYIVQARRSGRDWYVGAMTSTEGRTITINTTDFLDKGRTYNVEIYNDDPQLTTRTRVASTVIRKVKAGRRITLQLQPSGGAALHFREAGSER